MASVGGVSNSSSLYGNRAIISGLVSGMDTESMIENSVAGINSRITSLQQRLTKLEWTQAAYRGVTTNLVGFSRKYTSYTSSTNLLSASFFNNAIINTSQGANASKVSASGRSTSDVKINGVKQLATAARYRVEGNGVLTDVVENAGLRSILGKEIDLKEPVPSSNVSGSISLSYGGDNIITISFGEDEIINDAAAFVDKINEKLKDEKITYNNGNFDAASDVIEAKLTNGVISFEKKQNTGENLYIRNVTGDLYSELGKPSVGENVTSLDVSSVAFTSQVNRMEKLGGQTVRITLDGVTKTITLPNGGDLTLKANSSDPEEWNKAMVKILQEKIDEAFGANKINITNEAVDPTTKLALNFEVQAKGSNLEITSDVNSVLGLDANATSYLNTGKTLGDLLSDDLAADYGLVLEDAMGKGEIREKSDGTWVDSEGNRVNASGYLLDEDGDIIQGYKLELNGKTIGYYTEETALETILMDINSNSEVGFNVTYSKTTNQFVFTATGTGEGYEFDYQDSNLAAKIFGKRTDGNFTDGQDAVLDVSINNQHMELSRSTNTFDIDGMSITLNGTFNYDENGDLAVDAADSAVTFNVTSDADKIVDAISSFIEDFNAIMTELRAAYNTMPLQQSNGSKYEPLTDADRAAMSESAIAAYEESAKTGLLFGDKDISALYNLMLDAVTPGGVMGEALRNMGITTEYSSGLTTLTLDEEKLREMLSTNPDEVRDAFAGTSGIMNTVKGALDAYASTEGAVKGILIQKAGSIYATTSLYDNDIKDQMDAIDEQIARWKDKLSMKVDYYTRQFTRLETLLAKINAQSESIYSLMYGNSDS